MGLPQVSDELIMQSLCGVVVVGAPGTGKTTFCRALQEFFG
jgi:predicted PilT family ATPase